MLTDTLKIASAFAEVKDWNKLNDFLDQHNIILKNKSSTQKRQIREIKFRLQQLPPELLERLTDSDLQTTKLILLLAIVKLYPIIFEFIVEVLREKWFRFDYEILNSDFPKFWDMVQERHPELANVTDSTRAKIEQVIYRILAEVGLIDSVKTKRIVKPYVPEFLIQQIVKDNPDYLKVYLFSDAEIKTYIGKYGDTKN